MVPAGRGEKNNDRVRVRNRRYKIKRYMLQPRDIEVRHNSGKKNGKSGKKNGGKKTNTVSKHPKKTRIPALFI